MNREIKTDLNNILSHIACAIDYGYYDDVLMCDFASLTGYVSDEEIKWYCDSSMSDEYGQKDWDCWHERITEWRDKYCEKDDT